MPDALAGFCIKRKQAIGEKILTGTIRSVKIKRRRRRRNEYDASFFVQCHSCPAISATISLAGVSAPCVSAELTWFRDYMEDPFQLAGVDIEGADITGCRWKFIRHFASHDKKIVKHYSRCV